MAGRSGRRSLAGADGLQSKRRRPAGVAGARREEKEIGKKKEKKKKVLDFGGRKWGVYKGARHFYL